jgi:hypothetical protein
VQDGEIQVETLGAKGRTYNEFLEDLQQKDGDKDDCRFCPTHLSTAPSCTALHCSALPCRYAVHDYQYQYKPQGAEAQVS